MLHWVVAASCPYPLHHYLNDFFGAVPSTADPTQPVRLLSLACKALGFSLSPEKTLHSQTRLEILGIEIDSATQTVGITDTRCQRIRSVCSTLVSKSCVSLLELQQIAGLLQFVTQVAPHDRAYLSRIYSTLRRAHRSPCSPLQLPKPAVDELRWWSDLLSRWCGSSIITHSPLVATHIWSDVSLHALGGHLGSADATVTTFFRDVPRCHRKKNIRFLEALAVLDSLRAFLPHILALSASHVVLHVDNENVEHSLRSRHSHDPLTQTLLREIFGLCFMHNLRVVPVWVSSTDNVLADLLLRRRFSQIRRQFPAAHLQVFPPAAPTTSSQVPPLPASARSPLRSPDNSAALPTPPLSSGTVSTLCPDTSTFQPAQPIKPSAPASLAYPPPACWPQAQRCSSGSLTSAKRVARTMPSAVASPLSSRGTPTSASTLRRSPMPASAAGSVASSASTACAAEARSTPSLSPSCRAFSSSFVPSQSCSGNATLTPRRSPWLTPASSGALSSPGAPSTLSPHSRSARSRGTTTLLSFASHARRRICLGKVRTLSSLALAAQCALTGPSAASALGATRLPPFLSSIAARPSCVIESSRLFESSSVALGSRRRRTLAIPSAAALPLGPLMWALLTQSSRRSAAGLPTATSATSISPQPSVAAWRRRSSSALSTRTATRRRRLAASSLFG
ncbi:hypothetical protein sr16400 [Sporisorium reilianum SRZ2]|uniref:Reverse transcriptase domain-containing protein n=1 Tax=Sporisorium reilianum (strain SRZ2) TaxID=999809 RepID=E6ZSI8_SPORE|nr:hypothetical protein sr16400 [Sporisorium reilianum SRZ2]